MEQEQWPEWIEWKGGECPIPHAQFGEYELKFADGGGYPEFNSDGECNSLHFRAAYFRECWKHIGAATGHRKITAYRVRLTARQPTEPRKAKEIDFEVVRWPDLPETEPDRDIDIGDGVDENAPMLARDSAGMVKAVEPVPEFELQIEAEEAPWLLVVAPLERLGATRWGV